jgi:branched-chain amino acid transport system substrate-binding protein
VVGATTVSRPLYAQAAAPDKIRIGYAIALSGPFAPGAQSTSWSQYKLWQKNVNDAGGIMLKKYNKKVPIELIDYDDKSQPDELVRLVERLILNDRVDLVLGPWGTHMNLAVAPVINKHEYPVIFTTAAAASLYDLAPRWPYAFWSLVQPNEATGPLAEIVADLKKDGKAKGRVATIFSQLQLGVELHTAFLAACKKHNLEVTYSKGYPAGVSDLQPLLREAMATDPDGFFAFSYPPDTFMVTEQAKIVGFSPPIWYTAIGTPFPGFKGKFGNNVEGILMYGGVDAGAQGIKEYYAAHKAMFNRDSEAGAVGVYGCLEVVQQAIEAVGEIDRKKIRDAIAAGPFKTVWGDIKFKDQRNENPWSVGQWQNGEVVGIYPKGKSGARPFVFPKPKWTA